MKCSGVIFCHPTKCVSLCTGRSRDDVLKEADKALAFFKEEFGFHFTDVTEREKLGEFLLFSI